MSFKHFVLTILMLGVVAAQNDLSDTVNSLPPELQANIDENQINEITNKSKAVFKDKCDKNGGPGAYNNSENAFKGFTTCLESLVNVTLLREEIEEAKPKGNVDEVFKKYCGKSPQFKECFRGMVDSVKPCFSVEEQKNIKIVHNVSEQLAEFVCFKEGDRIALFIAEGGPECYTEKQELIQECFNSTFDLSGVSNGIDNFTVDSIPKFEFTEKQCNQMSSLQECVVNVLEQCKQPTTANIVESLFKFIRQSTPCQKIDEEEQSKSSGRSSTPNEPGGKGSAGVFTAMPVYALATISLLLYV